ncbi:EIN3-binding F-box protein 2-like [Impatiens glandulifera]|uniref:EIN3-binding F-box protein 2-like n=1 Tax=Impatiens glandulifera TaxID=253017 RepID=UPI001FB04D6C|nr:EIN3-binding F-box protein 2-like [Impatiens glandulifera]
MPSLIDYTVDDDLYTVGSRLDVYYPPSKRARFSSLVASSDNFDNENRTTSIEVLPDECLFEIFRRVTGGKAKMSSACVSKRWLMIMSSIRSAEICKNEDVEMIHDNVNVECESDGYLTRCLEGKKATDIRLAAIAIGTSSQGGLGKLSIRGSNFVRGVTNFGLSAIAHGCPSLKSLSLWDVPFVGDEGMLAIANDCRSLEKLDLCQCPSITNKGLIAIAENCPNLTTLAIESCPNIGDEALLAIGRCCSRLQSITIRDCSRVRDQGLAGLLLPACSSLTKIKLHGLTITDFSLAVIGHYGKALTTLILCGLQNVSQKGFWVMANGRGLDKLVSLTITSCRGTTDVSLEAIGKGCSNLKHMNLKKCCFVSDAGLVAFAKAAGSLESLQMEECNRITQAGILSALSNSGSKLKSLGIVKCMGIKDHLPLDMTMLSPCESLRSLSIRSCPGFSNSSLAVVGKLCPQLHHVDLSGLVGISDAGLLPLLETCKGGLVKVNLSGCLNLTDRSISTMAKLHGESLEVLNLEGCRNVTDASLVAVAENCLAMNDLDLSNCSVSDLGISVLSFGGQMNLQILSLSGCTKLSDKVMPYLSKLGKTLVGLNLQKCNSISGQSIELLVESLWRCDILY